MTMNPTSAEQAHTEVTQRSGITVVVPPGPRLDAEVAASFREQLLGLIERGERQLVLDLPAVDFIDSSGLGALVSALKRLRQLDPAGDIRLANVQPPVRSVLEIIRLHRVFSQFPTVEDALASYEARV